MPELGVEGIHVSELRGRWRTGRRVEDRSEGWKGKGRSGYEVEKSQFQSGRAMAMRWLLHDADVGVRSDDGCDG